LAVLRVPEGVRIELGRALDLVLAAVHEDLPILYVDVLDRASGKQDLLAEDPRAGVDHQVAGPDIVRSLVHLADVAVGGLDVESDEVSGPGPDVSLVRVGPRIPTSGHRTAPSLSHLLASALTALV